jgi:Flp pilus assembly protein TadG
MKRSARSLWRNSEGAVAPLVALSLTALIAAGGVAFDYARVASMDTELQSAADQAALAAAAQLDGNDGACSRAAAAANGMLANKTYMSNDGNGTAITIPNESTCDATGQIRFYKDINKTQAATDDADAKFVEVTVDSRTAVYALTPIVAAFSSGAISATAFAGLNSAICKVPPLMLCNPNETSDPNFTISNYVGKGIRLIANDPSTRDPSQPQPPGDFGFLASGLTTNGANGANVLRQVLGRVSLAEDCVSGDGVTTDPGNMISVRDALNTRFDIYDNGLNNACGSKASDNAALCPASINTRKDLLQKGNGNNNCGLVVNGNANGWEQPAVPYPGVTLPAEGPLSWQQAASLSPTGYPEDICHAFSATGDCANGRVGDGNWDRLAYFRSHPRDYPEVAALAQNDTAGFNNLLQGWFQTTTPTRYQVYKWEMQNAAARLHTGVSDISGSLKASSQPVCATPGITPSDTQIDRRVLTVAVVNCTAENVKGRTTDVDVAKWIDIFLTQPSLARTVGTPTTNSDVYVEVVGQSQNATDAGAVQLVKKSVPYLIE